MGDLYCRTQTVEWDRRRSSIASKPTITSGTTSRALKTEPQARATVGVPEKYKWWQVPMMPPERKIVAESRADLAAKAGRIKPRRVKKKAITVVANTSKKPSTQRCTTHQRQYSTMVRCVCCPQVSPAP